MYLEMDDLEFEERFLPHRDASGAWRQYLWWEPADQDAIAHAAAQCRVWTMVDADGECVLSAGWHFVNRLHYVITELPHPDWEIAVRDRADVT